MSSNVNLSLTLADGTVLKLFSDVISLVIDADIFSAADSCSVVFTSKKHIGEISKVSVYIGGDLRFKGICDKQLSERVGVGLEITLQCRSLAAYMVDNDFMPGNYTNMQYQSFLNVLANSADVDVSSEDSVFELGGYFKIGSSTTYYDALTKFLKLTKGSTPRIDSVGVYRRNWLDVPEAGLISNENEEGVPFLSAQRQFKRSAAIGRIVSPNLDGLYTVGVTNTVAESHGITNEVYRSFAGYSESERYGKIETAFAKQNGELERYTILADANQLPESFTVGASISFSDSLVTGGNIYLVITGHKRMLDEEGDRVLITATPYLNVVYY
ncbi:MAG: hypothetical protein IJY56_00955 [Clostridia bacterium]|nr:hypothetical protein [Clostridia bacterium]